MTDTIADGLVERVARALYERDGFTWQQCVRAKETEYWLEQARAAIAAIPPAGRVEEWQPIETAPKDGTQILLSAEDWVVQGRYLNHACRWFELNTDPTDAWDGEIYQPTHWRPLPDPPALSGEGR